MNTSVPRSMRRLALCACAATALGAPSAASAAEPQRLIDLHVEAGRTLVSDVSYQTGTTTTVTDRSQPGCGGTGKEKTLRGPTALGTLVDAEDVTAKLRPLRITDKFSFGLLVCGIGPAVANGTDSFWLYKVNHVAPEVGADKFKVKSGDEVLWYFSNPSGLNTGDELDISAPARARAGSGVKVKVFAYDFMGKRTPAAGAKVSFGGGRTATTDAQGVATVRRASDGEIELRATRGNDIPSPAVRVCVAELLRRCSPVRGKRIFGTLDSDSLSATRGPDVVDASRGNDRIDVRGGRSDLVRCGIGTDRVRATREDRVSRDCEVVNGKARRKRH